MAEAPVYKTTEVSAGERTYVITSFPGRTGLCLKASLVKLVGPGAIGFVLQFKDAISATIKEHGFQEIKDKATMAAAILDTDLDEGALSHILNSLCDRLDEKNVVKLILDLLKYTTVDGVQITPEIFDLYFASNYMEMYKVLGEVIRFNFFG